MSSAVSLPHAEKNPTHQSNLFNTRQLSNHQSFSTIIWKEISIISVDIDDLTEITYHFIETCNFEWNKHCEKVYYGHLNIGIPDIFTTDIYQKSVYQSISLKSKCTENIQNNVNAQFDHFNSNDNNKDNGRSVISTISKAVFTNESMYVRSIVPMKWIYYTTRWSNYLVPGRQLTENFLKPNWASPYRRASSRQLFEDLHRYILNVEWPHASQIFILDPLVSSGYLKLSIDYDLSLFASTEIKEPLRKGIKPTENVPIRRKIGPALHVYSLLGLQRSSSAAILITKLSNVNRFHG
ncbi:unnamed protein product [Trichobilharzia regenti]|nr:unnamed protein product [Trichobilharzia regenti]